MIRILCSWGILWGMLFLWVGCETTSSNSANTTKAQDQIFLKKGMNAQEIRSLLGDPLEIEETAGAEGILQTWTYEDSREYVRQVEADTREVPYYHPISREQGTRTEVVTKVKRDRIVLVTELFLLNGKLVGWKETQKDSILWDE